MKTETKTIGQRVKVKVEGNFYGRIGTITSFGKAALPVHVTLNGEKYETDFKEAELEAIEEPKKQGKILFEKRGIIRTYTCTCGAGCAEADEWGVHCIYAPEYGLNGCGASRAWGDEQ